MSLCRNRELDEETTNNEKNKLPVQDLTVLNKIPASKSQSSLRKGRKSYSVPKSVKFKDEELKKLKLKKKESILKFVEITDDSKNQKSEDDEKLNESRDSNISGLKFDDGFEQENEKQKEKKNFSKNNESGWNLVRESLVSSIINSKDDNNIDKKSENNDEEKNKENLFNNSFDNNNNNHIEKNEIKDDNNEKEVKENHIEKEKENIINNDEKKEKEQNEKKSEEELEEEEEDEKENSEKGGNKENKKEEKKIEEENKENKEEEKKIEEENKENKEEEKKIEEVHIEKENKIDEIKEEKKEEPQNNDNKNNNNLNEEEKSNIINDKEIKNKDDNNISLRSKPKPKEEKKEKVQEEDEEEEEEEEDDEEENKPKKKETIKEAENEELSKYKSLIKIINKNLEANGFSKLDIKNQIDELYKTFPDPISEEELIPKLSDHLIKLLDITIDSDKNEIKDCIKDVVILFEGDKDKIYHQLMNFIEDIVDQDKLKNNQTNRIIRTYLKDCEEKLKNRLKEEDIPSDKIITFEKFFKILEEKGIKLKEEYMKNLLYQMKIAVPKGKSINTLNANVIVDFLK